jgi:choline dehydrogenase-like flavoprotein
MSEPSKEYDYVIVGGGLAGCVLARRLSDKYSSSSILVVEAGGRPEDNPLIGPPLVSFGFQFSDIDWAYKSVPQKHLGGRPAYQTGGKFQGTVIGLAHIG